MVDVVAIRNMYQQMAPLGEVLAKVHEHLKKNVSVLEFQDALVSDVFNCDDCQDYPPSERYTCILLKRIVKIFEEYAGEDGMSDSFAEFVLIKISSSKYRDLDEDHDYCYQTFHLPNKNICPLRIIRSHNEVGLRIWSAGLFLAELCISCASDLLHERRVVELGAGVGCTLLIALKGIDPSIIKPKSVILTEGPPGVVANLEYNVTLNFPAREETAVDCVETKVVTALRLDWTEFCNIDNTVSNLGSFSESMRLCDVVLAADCTYSEDISVDLLRTFELLLGADSGMSAPVICEEEKKSVQSKSRVGFVAATIRNHKTYDHFLNLAMNSRVLECEDVTLWAQEKVIANTQRQRTFFYDNVESIRVLQLRPKTLIASK